MKIIGVDCPSCVYAIQRRLGQLNCVEKLHVDVNTGLAEVEYDGRLCKLKDIYSAIRDVGYDVYKEKLTVDLKGLDIDERIALDEAVSSTKGVLETRVSLSLDYGLVSYNPLDANRSEIEDLLWKYGVRVVDRAEVEVGFAEKTLLHRRILSFAIGFTVLASSMIAMLHGLHILEEALHLTAPPLAVIALLSNYDIIIRGSKSLARAVPTMDSLITLSSISTFTAGVLSLAGVLGYHGNLYPLSFFEASAGVIGFVGLGRYMEERLRRRALKSIKEYSSILKKKARVVHGNTVLEKYANDIQPGEVVEVRAGEVIPVDGVVVEGYGYVDESTFTGEPAPSLKKSDSRDPVLAGSFLLSGYIRVRATRVGDDTLFGYIIESVGEAELAKPRIARFADRAVGYFTWIVLALSLVTLIYWWLTTQNVQLAVFFMAAVLVVACPCALGIAIPMVISVSVLKLSRSGLLIRRGDVFERVLAAKVVLLDKTGTITHGKPVLRRVHIVKPINARDLLAYVCSVESRSEHPISTALMEKCREEGIETVDPADYVSFPGEGVYGVVNGVRVAVGNYELVAKRLGVEVNPEVHDLLNEIGSRGGTPVIVALNTEIAGIIEVGDKLRDEAREVVTELKRRGFVVGIASGDVEKNVLYYKNLLDLDLGFWGLKPSDKADLVRKLRESYGRVVFVGDGVNDAPAITVADVGVAMGTGAEISREVGDVVVTGNNLKTLIVLLDFARLVKKKMLENLVWAFVYNVALIPIAMGLLYHGYGVFISPQIAAAAMVLSDVSVVLNSLSVLRHRTEPCKIRCEG